jgi:hypothetical protein
MSGGYHQSYCTDLECFDDNIMSPGDTEGMFDFVSDIGHAIGSAAKAVGKGVKAVGAVAGKGLGAISKVVEVIPGVKQVHNLIGKVANKIPIAKEAYAIANQVRRGENLVNVAGNTVKLAAPIVQAALKNMGPIGMAASGALGAMAAGLSGKSLKDIALAAVVGATPSGLDAAVRAALSGNKNAILGEVINQVGNSFLPGTMEKLGADKALAALKKGASVVQLNAIKKTLKTPGSLKAFESVVGSVAKVAKKASSGKGVLKSMVSHTVPKHSGGLFGAVARVAKTHPIGVKMPVHTRLKRPGRNNKRPSTSGKGVVRRMTPALSASVAASLRTIAKNPALAMNPGALAARLQTRVSAVNRAIKLAKGRALPFKRLSPRAQKFVAPYFKRFRLPHSLLGGDTKGLTEDGKQYQVEPGDSMVKTIAKLTGITSGPPLANAMVAYVKANPIKTVVYNPTTKLNEFKFYKVGEKLNIPAAWTVKPAPVVVTPQPSPAPKPVVIDTKQGTPVEITAAPKPVDQTIAASILQSKGLLATWGKTDGANQPGLTDYGMRPEDQQAVWGSRDKLMMMAFENFYNKNYNGRLTVNGDVDPESIEALRAWTEAKAKQVVTPVLPPGGDPISRSPVNDDGTPIKTGGVPVTVQPGPIAQNVPPAPTPVVIPSGQIAIPGGPVITTPEIILPGAIDMTTPAVPPVTATTNEDSVTPATDEQGSLAPLVLGAGAGAVVGGPVGAIVGGLIGLALGGKESNA